MATLNQASPAAETSNPAAQMVAGASQRVSTPAATGSTTSGADSAIIKRPAWISRMPSMAMKWTGSRISSTTNA
ncbi:hypothetical protein D3C71_1565410 [compost metagenome]